MNPEQLWLSFQLQREEFGKWMSPELVKHLGELHTVAPTPKDARAFGEILILCPTSESAKTHMLRDLKGARAFLTIADQISESAIETLSAESAPEVRQRGTRFFVLSYFVLQFLIKASEQHPDLFD